MRFGAVIQIGLPTLVLATTAFVANRPPEPPCVVAARWVEAHSKSLPQTLQEFSGYSLAYRKAIYLALPHEKKVALWHEQFAYYLNRPGLTIDQRALLSRSTPC